MPIINKDQGIRLYEALKYLQVVKQKSTLFVKKTQKPTLFAQWGVLIYTQKQIAKHKLSKDFAIATVNPKPDTYLVDFPCEANRLEDC